MRHYTFSEIDDTSLCCWQFICSDRQLTSYLTLLLSLFYISFSFQTSFRILLVKSNTNTNTKHGKIFDALASIVAVDRVIKVVVVLFCLILYKIRNLLKLVFLYYLLLKSLIYSEIYLQVLKNLNVQTILFAY